MQRELIPRERAATVAFSRNDRWLATATYTELSIWETRTWRLVRRISKDQSCFPQTPAFSPDGRLLAFCTSNSVIELLDTSSWESVARLQGPDMSSIKLGEFSPDGSRIVVSAGTPGAIKVWDLRTIREQLKQIGLDWDQPDFPPPPLPAGSSNLRVEVRLVDFQSIVRAQQHYTRGVQFVKMRKSEQALIEFSAAIALKPDFIQFWTARARTHSELGHGENAILDYSEAIRRDPGNAALWYWRGLARARLTECILAVGDFSRAIDLDRSKAMYWSCRGIAHGSLAQWSRATRDLSQAVVLNPRDWGTWHALALAHLAQDDLGAYRRTCAGMLRQFATIKQADGASLAAWTCALAPDAVADPSQIVALAERAVRSDPRSPIYRTSLGAALYRAGRPRAALERLSEAHRTPAASYAQRGSSSAYAALFLAMAHHRLGSAREARTSFVAAASIIESERKAPHQRRSPAGMWYRELTLKLLRREAEALIGVENPRPVAAARPTDRRKPVVAPRPRKS
jgi:tetratricopeptide (TPR) repeat protein